MSHYISLGSTFIPRPKSYNQTRLGLQFQIKRNPYTKRTLTIKENIKTILCDRLVHHPESIGNPCAFLQSHRQTAFHSHPQPSELAIGMTVSPLLDLVIFGCFSIGTNPHRQLSCRLVTISPLVDLHSINSPGARPKIYVFRNGVNKGLCYFCKNHISSSCDQKFLK